jgi:hypothetical protein
MPKSTGTDPAYPAARGNTCHRLRFGEVTPTIQPPQADWSVMSGERARSIALAV